MARNSYQKGRIEQRERKNRAIFVLRYRLYKGDKRIEKTEELKNENGQPCKNSKEANKAANARMFEVNRINNGAGQIMTMDEFVKGLWQHQISKVKASTAYHYESMMRLYILPEFGLKILPEIRPQAITMFFARLARKKLSSASRLVLYQLLNTLFETAMAYDLIESSPMRCKLHRPSLERKEKPALTADEIRRVIEATSEKHRPLFLCMALTGLRIGELLGLRWQDIDFQNRRLTVTRTLWRKQLLTPKTDASKRTLHLPAALLDILNIQRHQSAWVAPDDFVFAKEDGAPLNADTMRVMALYPALEKAGIVREKSAHGFHLFRHSAASIVHAETRDISLAQELLGHSRLSTTADIYTHTRNAAERATETLAREIWGSCGLSVAESSAQVN